MACLPANFFVFLLPLLVAVAAAADDGERINGVNLDLHHRFSPVVRQWAEANGRLNGWWPEDHERRSPEYYEALGFQDRHRARRLYRRRGLASNQGLTFADGNDTLTNPVLAFIHYAFVSLGSPNVTFLVGLDTGSSFLWVPCDCENCASLSANYGVGNIELGMYSPSKSTTSHNVSCSNPLCTSAISTCSSPVSTCSYEIHYGDSSSTSGVMIQDLLYLASEGDKARIVEAPVVFGCSQFQTGSLFEGGAPDGLLGLGMLDASVPNQLAHAGVVSNRFSMCFSPDGTGRIHFGDTGSSDQYETPIVFNPLSPEYNIRITAVTVGDKTSRVSMTALVDSGTTFTALSDPLYTVLASNFDAQVQDKRKPSSPSSQFEYCYTASGSQSDIIVPMINFKTESGCPFPVLSPLVVYENDLGVYKYCLAVVKSEDNIIGVNFMAGLRIVFNNEKHTLGWEPFDCYQDKSAPITSRPLAPRIKKSLTGSSLAPPTTPADMRNLTSPEMSPVPSPAMSPSLHTSDAIRLNAVASIVLMLLMHIAVFLMRG